jgi:hypothetical protein
MGKSSAETSLPPDAAGPNAWARRARLRRSRRLAGEVFGPRRRGPSQSRPHRYVPAPHSGKQLPQTRVDRPLRSAPPPRRSELEAPLRSDRRGAHELVHNIIDQEAVVCWDDLLMRRTDWGSCPIGPDFSSVLSEEISKGAASFSSRRRALP